MSNFPIERYAISVYGDPRGRNGEANPKWEAANLVRITAPFQLYYDGKPVKSIRIHRKCSDSLKRVFWRIWEAAGQDQHVVDEWGASRFAGSYVYRLKRGGTSISMHGLGIALDLDPARNAFHDETPNFANAPQYAVVEAFEAEGWEWGGRWTGRSCDGMHFQATKPRYTPPAPKLITTAPVPKEEVRDDRAAVVEELREKGSRTIAATSSGKKDLAGVVISSISADAIVESAPALKQTVDTAVEAAGGKESVITWLVQHWQWPVAAVFAIVALIFAYRVYRAFQHIEFARADDALSGLHMGRR